MVFPHRFRERVGSQRERTSEPAATCAAVKASMRCLVACGLLLGGLQFSKVSSIFSFVAATLSGSGDTAGFSASGSSGNTHTGVAYEDSFSLKDFSIQPCFSDFLKEQSREGNPFQDVPNVRFPLLRWVWLKDEMDQGFGIIGNWTGKSSCNRDGLEAALRNKLGRELKRQGISLHFHRKGLIYQLIKKAVRYRDLSTSRRHLRCIKKIFLKRGPCKKNTNLWRYLGGFEICPGERKDICRRITNEGSMVMSSFKSHNSEPNVSDVGMSSFKSHNSEPNVSDAELLSFRSHNSERNASQA